MYTVKGIKRSQGVYEGYEYDNINIHCVGVDDGSMWVGQPVEVITMKEPVFRATCKRLNIDPEELEGANIRPYYRRNSKKANDFDILDA